MVFFDGARVCGVASYQVDQVIIANNSAETGARVRLKFAVR